LFIESKNNNEYCNKILASKYNINHNSYSSPNGAVFWPSLDRDLESTKLQKSAKIKVQSVEN
jgi:hypothetical protein